MPAGVFTTVPIAQKGKLRPQEITWPISGKRGSQVYRWCQSPSNFHHTKLLQKIRGGIGFGQADVSVDIGTPPLVA